MLFYSLILFYHIILHHSHTRIQWGGERDKRHGTILVQAMIRRGLLYDAWQGLLISEVNEALLALPYRELLLSVIKMLSQPKTNSDVNSNIEIKSNPNLNNETNSNSKWNLNFNINFDNDQYCTDVQETSKIKLSEKQQVEVAAFCIFALMKIDPRQNE
jgi:hypothetical protein